MTRRTFNKLLAWMGIAGAPSIVRAIAKREPILVEGPTPPELIKGRLGQTYVIAAHPDCYHISQAWLDGVNVSSRACEADTVAGWVRMYDVRYGGKGQMIIDCSGEATIQRIHFGKVQVR